MNTDPQADQSAINENIQRTVERAALHKVRKLADELEAEQIAKHRLEKRALIVVAVVVTVFAVWFVLGLVTSDEKFDRGQKFQVPDKVVLPKKD